MGHHWHEFELVAGQFDRAVQTQNRCSNSWARHVLPATKDVFDQLIQHLGSTRTSPRARGVLPLHLCHRCRSHGEPHSVSCSTGGVWFRTCMFSALSEQVKLTAAFVLTTARRHPASNSSSATTSSMEGCRPPMISPPEDPKPQPELARPQHSPRCPGPSNTDVCVDTAAAEPAQHAAEAQHLPDVWRHLKQLDRAVKSHIQSADGGSSSPQHASTHASGGIGRGCSSILAAAQHQHATDESSSSDEDSASPAAARAARMSERDRLKESLSRLKSEVADKVVKQVEAQLLQQRVACLEAALAGLAAAGGGALTAAGCPSCAGSYAGTMLSLSPGRASVCLRCQQRQGQQQQQQQQQQPLAQQQAPRTSSPMSLEPGAPPASFSPSRRAAAICCFNL